MARCEAYIAGVFDENVGAGRFGYDEFRFCPPDVVSLDQISGIVREHLKNFPNTHDAAANKLILAALFNAYPCEN